MQVSHSPGCQIDHRVQVSSKIHLIKYIPYPQPYCPRLLFVFCSFCEEISAQKCNKKWKIACFLGGAAYNSKADNTGARTVHDKDRAWYIFLEPQIMAKFLKRSYNFSQDIAECDAAPVMKWKSVAKKSESRPQKQLLQQKGVSRLVASHHNLLSQNGEHFG